MFGCFSFQSHIYSLHMSFNYSKLDTGLQEAQEWLSKEYSRVHTGRAAPMLLDGVQVESYGALQPIKNVGSISVEDARTLRIQVWDKELIKDIEKAIIDANLGVTVGVDDNGMRINFPPLTTENRTKLAKILKERLEDARIRVRKARENAMDTLKAENLPEDDARRAKEEIQKKVDEANKGLEQTFSKKEEDILSL